MYFAFGEDNSSGHFTGMNDLRARCQTLEEARSIIEALAAENGGGDGYYEGHIATIENDDIVVKEWYAARVAGNVEAGKVTKQLWSSDHEEVNRFVSSLT